jgi:hypothetical protein
MAAYCSGACLKSSSLPVQHHAVTAFIGMLTTWPCSPSGPPSWIAKEAKSRPKSQAARSGISGSLPLAIVDVPGTAPRHTRGPLTFPSNVAWPHTRSPDRSSQPAATRKGVLVADGGEATLASACHRSVAMVTGRSSRR